MHNSKGPCSKNYSHDTLEKLCMIHFSRYALNVLSQCGHEDLFFSVMQFPVCISIFSSQKVSYDDVDAVK